MSPDIKKDKLDKYDFLIGAVMGVFSGLMDVFFVDKPGDGLLGKWSDKKTNDLVISYAQHLAKVNNKKNGANFVLNTSDDKGLQRAIQYLENYSKPYIPYDQKDSKAAGYAVSKMFPKNHHLLSMSHCPDLIGLCCSIINQFNHTSTFLVDGKVITINSASQELEGSNFVSKVYAGAGNWFTHLMSDVAGSNGAAGRGNRGSGIPIPFYNMFNLCDFGEFEINGARKPLSRLMVMVFEQGYDLRHGISMSIPLIVGNLLVMIAWSLKRKFYHHWDWQSCLPSDRYKSYRRTQLVNNGAFCLVDGIHASIRGAGNPIETVLRMNLMAWLRLIQLIIKELLLTFGRSYADLNADLAVISKALDDELIHLRSIDYSAWQQENDKMRDFNCRLKGKDAFDIGTLAAEYAFANDIKLNYSNFDEFEDLWDSNKPLF